MQEGSEEHIKNTISGEILVPLEKKMALKYFAIMGFFGVVFSDMQLGSLRGYQNPFLVYSIDHKISSRYF